MLILKESDHFTITINNQSDDRASYALFSAAPKVTPPVDKIWTNISAVFHGVASGSGQAYFSMPKQPYAICGTSNDDLDAGVLISVVDRRPVILGVQMKDGRLVPGTTLEVTVSDDAPAFTSAQMDPSGALGACCIQTRADFTAQGAKEGTFPPPPQKKKKKKKTSAF
jgi:hypothetical protein